MSLVPIASATFTSSSGSLNASAPSGAVAGDLLTIAVLNWGDSFGDLTTASGDNLTCADCERLPGMPSTDGTAFGDNLTPDSIAGGVFVRTVAGSGEPATYAVTGDGPNLLVTVSAWRGGAPIVVDYSDAVRNHDSQVGGGTSNVFTPTMSANAGDLAVYIAMTTASAFGPYSTADGTPTEHADSAFADRALAVASLARPTGGAPGATIGITDGAPFTGGLGFTLVLIPSADAPVCEVVDLFNRTGSGDLGTPDSGGEYAYSGTGNGSFDVAALAYVRQTGSGDAVQLVLHSATVAADAEVRIEWEWGDSLDAAALITMRVQLDYSGYMMSARREDAEGGRIAVYAAADVRAFDPATDTLVVDALVPIAVDDDTRFQFVAQTLGSTVRAKYYPLDDDPGGWQVSATDTTITGPGRIGFGHRYTGSAWPFLTYFDVLSTQCVAAGLRVFCWIF